jgi:hypothetical protein
MIDGIRARHDQEPMMRLPPPGGTRARRAIGRAGPADAWPWPGERTRSTHAITKDENAASAGRAATAPD